MSYENDDYENDYENEFNMEAEVNAHLRTSPGDILTNTLRIFKFKDKNLDEQFITLVDAAYEKLREHNFLFINNYAKEQILNGVDKLNKPGYKNAVAFILGFFASNYGSNLTEENVQSIFNILPAINKLSNEFPIFKVNKADVIRYARLWKNLV
jgi:hypothetical protein